MTIKDLIRILVRLRIFYDRNLLTESMRGNIIILGSVMDALLVSLIEKEDGPRKEAINSIKGGNKFKNFDQAINASLLLGIISCPTHNALHKLRKLRNDLAHGIAIYGNDDFVEKKVLEIATILKSENIDSDDLKMKFHGIAIKLIHGIGYDYGKKLGFSIDEITANWESIRVEELQAQQSVSSNSSPAAGSE